MSKISKDPKVFSHNVRMLMSGITPKGKVNMIRLSEESGVTLSTLRRRLPKTNDQIMDPECQKKIADYFNVSMYDLWTEGIWDDGIFSSVDTNIGHFNEPTARPVYDAFENGAPNERQDVFASFSGTEIGWIADAPKGFGIQTEDVVIFTPKYNNGDLCIAENEKEGIIIGYIDLSDMTVTMKDKEGNVLLEGHRDTRILGRVKEIRRLLY